MAAGTAMAVTAQAQSLNAKIDPRPLTPQEITDYGLGSAQIASGLTTVGVGQPLYLEALINSAVDPSNLVSVTWSVPGMPAGSSAAPESSPLGMNVPIFRQLDREDFQIASRTMFRPDLVGQYTVQASITTTTTNVVVSKEITAGTYLGAPTCAFCHTASPGIPAIFGTYTNTPHASAFTLAINGISTDHFNQNCIACHVVGFDKNTNAVNGGWDDIAAQLGWMFPTNISTTNWDSMPASLQHLSNVQCENCHGAGSVHAFMALTNVALAKETISVSFNPGDCAQCHDKLTHHFKTQEWNASKHAASPEENSASCARCHTSEGLANFLEGKPAVSIAEYEPIGCAGCHDPHDATQPHQLRPMPDIALMDKVTTVSEGGTGKICMQCHISRRDAVSYVETTAGSSRFGPHHGPQTDMLVGANAITYGKDIPSSAHAEVVEDSCVACHMQERENGMPGFKHAGGHTWNLSWDGGTPGDPSDDVHLTETCLQCHGEIENFDLKRQDYDGDGIVEGVQTEVKGLLEQVALLLPPVGSTTVTPTSTYTKPQLKALYNYLFVEEDGSFGVHNVAYAVGLLKASIADMTDDSDHDGLSDKWEIAQFGSLLYDGNSDNDGDGVNNSLEISAGTNPLLADTDGDGVNDLAELQAGSDPLNPSDVPGFLVQIYNAAEVEFASQVGIKYQVQRVSEVSGSWMNAGSVTNGTGAMISMPVSTRSGGAQGYFRVVQVP